MLNLEFQKVLKSKLTLILLLVTTVLFPVLIKIISHLSATSDNIPEGLFSEKVAQAILTFSQSYFFIPVWILIIIGIEFSNGHVNKIVFLKSRTYYFDLKLLYCTGVTLLFTLLAIFTFVITVQFSPYKSLSIESNFFGLFILQFAISSFTCTLLLMLLVFIFRSPAYAFIFYLGWTFIEGILISVFKGLYGIHLKYLPMQIPRSFYLKYDGKDFVYYNPFKSDLFEVIIPTGICLIVLLILRSIFSKSEIKALTD